MGSDVDMTMTPAQRIAAWLAPAMQRADFELDRGSGGRKDFAEAVGVAPGTITRWLQGKTAPDPDKYEAIAKALGVDTIVMLTEWGVISAKAVTSGQATEVRSRPMAPSQAAAELGIDDPVEREMFIRFVGTLGNRPKPTAAPDNGSSAAEG